MIASTCARDVAMVALDGVLLAESNEWADGYQTGGRRVCQSVACW